MRSTGRVYVYTTSFKFLHLLRTCTGVEYKLPVSDGQEERDHHKTGTVFR